MSRARRSDGRGAAGAAAEHGVVFVVPPRSIGEAAAAGSDHESGLEAARGEDGAREAGGVSQRRVSHSRFTVHDELLNVSQVEHHVSGLEYWRSFEQLAESAEVTARLDQEFPGYSPEHMTGTSR